MKLTTLQNYLRWSDLFFFVAIIALFTMHGDSEPEPSLEMPAMMKRPELSLPESPLLQPQQMPTPSLDTASQLRQQWKKVKKLEVNMMNGELDRFKSTPAGATDPDSIWRGQMMQADKALLEAGLPALNVRKF